MAKGKQKKLKPLSDGDRVDLIIQYESGTISNDDGLRLFQNLVDTGLAWQLQGCYGRTAQSLLDDGLILGKDRYKKLVGVS
jgi:hypothetical protein